MIPDKAEQRIVPGTDVMSQLAWRPNYQNALPLDGLLHSENIVIRRPSLWPTATSLPIADATAGEPRHPRRKSNPTDDVRQKKQCAYLHDLLDTRSGRLVRGYLRIGSILPEAHVLSCTLAANAYSSIAALNSASQDATATVRIPEMRSLSQKLWRTAVRMGPIEYLVSIGFLFEGLLRNHLELMPVNERPQWNNQRAECGRQLLCFLLDQEPANALIVQAWLDRAAQHCAPLFECARQALESPAQHFPPTNQFQALDSINKIFSGLGRYGLHTPTISSIAKH